MAGLIVQDVIDRILNTTDIVELIRPYLHLKQTGSQFKGLCPFHEDKNPSLIISPEYQRYKCWACDASGNALDFVMDMDSVTFPEACELLADRAGIEIVREGRESASAPAGPSKREIFRVNEWAAKYFARRLLQPSGEECAKYLTERGIVPETWELFQIGHAPEGWDTLCLAAKKKGIPAELLQAAGLAQQSRRGTLIDVFRNRLMFPIRDASKRVLGFGGRCLDGEEPKYVNTSETPVFSKSRCLFGANRLQGSRSGRPLFVMEGYTDVTMAAQAGGLDAVATLGTALTDDHARFLQRLGRPVILVFDGDSAGRKAAERGGRIFASVDLDLKITGLKKGEDPCDYLLRTELDGAALLESEAVDYLEFILRESMARHPIETVNGKVQVAKEMLALIGAMQNPVKISASITKVADTLGVPEPDLRKELNERPTLRRITPKRAAIAEEEPEVRPVVRAVRIAEQAVLLAVMNARQALGGLEVLSSYRFETPEQIVIFRAALTALSGAQGPVGSIVLGGLQDAASRKAANALILEGRYSDEKLTELSDSVRFLVDRSSENRLSDDVRGVSAETGDDEVARLQQEIREKHNAKQFRAKKNKTDSPATPPSSNGSPELDEEDGTGGADDMDAACF